LQSSLHFGQVPEILDQGVSNYLKHIVRQCQEIHQTIYALYVHYSIEAALAG
jgi:uncharacterized alpha-E superfamily protein